MLKTHGIEAGVPVQSPAQPVNVEPGLAVGVSVTIVPSTKLQAQVAPQSIPTGALATVPAPVPDFVTVIVRNVGKTNQRSKSAQTDVSPSITMLQSFHTGVPAQAPPQAACSKSQLEAHGESVVVSHQS